MIILYVKTGCPFSAKVMQYLNDNNVAFEEKNVSDEANLQTVAELEGMTRTPFMVDGETMMGESVDIIAYVQATYVSGDAAPGGETATDPLVCNS